MIRCTGFDAAYCVASFVADTTADVSNTDLPSIDKEGTGDFAGIGKIGMGSDITVISPASVYMLNSTGTWVKM